MTAQVAARLLLALLLSTAVIAAGDPPFPHPERSFTLGEFLRAVAAPDALDLNLVVRASVPRDHRIETSFREMSCRQALDLVLALEELELVEFRPGLYIVARQQDRVASGPTLQRRFQLTHATAERVIAALRASPRLAARIDVDGLSAGTDPHTLIAVDSAAGLAALGDALATLDAASSRRPVVLPVSFLGRAELDAALRTLGPEALAGLPPTEIANLPNGRGIAVNGTPDQVERVKAVLAQLDVPPASVTVGVSSASRAGERSRRSSIDSGGTVADDRLSTNSDQSGVIWVTTLSGSPARIALQQIFNVRLAQVNHEVPVGLALEVLPRVAGSAVLVTVRLVDSSPTRVSDVGVDRSTRDLVTDALVPRGGSLLIGGLSTALAQSARADVLGATALRRSSDLTFTLFVK